MYDDGLNGDFEVAHHKGLRRGFDLGWSYKGRFDREIIRQEIERLKNRAEARGRRDEYRYDALRSPTT